jgi:hypothetical protein
MRIAVGLAIACAVGALTTPAFATPSQDLNRARDLFKQKDFAGALPILNTLVYPRVQLSQSHELVETYAMLGACLVETGQVDRAKIEFESALRLEPDRALTEGYYPTASIHVFEETKAKVLADAKVVQDAQHIQEMRARVEAYKNSVQIFELHPYSRNFVPFGAGQFQNRTPIRGIVFAATESIALATSVGTWFYLINTYGLNAHVSREQGISVLRLQRIEVASGIAFIGLYAVGVIDSLVHYKPRVKGEFDESLLPPELRESLKKPKKTSLRDRIHLTPMLSPDSVGIGIGWEN